MGVALLALGFYSIYKDKSTQSKVTLILGTFLLTTEFFVPPLATLLFKKWMAFAHLLGKINTTLIITLIYVFIFIPIGFFRQHLSAHSRKNTLKKIRAKQTNWSPLHHPSTPQSYFHPY